MPSPDTETDPALDPIPMPPGARALLPLQGVTVLAVEDSRFASDALRLMCQRSGARLRRAETIEAAEAHLRLYRPDVILVDLGLPDGRGENLIRRLRLRHGTGAVIGMSGDPMGRAGALAAGASAFIDKPIAGLAAFQQAILAQIPDGPSRLPGHDGAVTADLLALHDDLALAARALDAGPGPEQRRYLAGFLHGVARQTKDAALDAASDALIDPQAGLQPLAQLLSDRLAQSEPFRPRAG